MIVFSNEKIYSILRSLILLNIILEPIFLKTLGHRKVFKYFRTSSNFYTHTNMCSKYILDPQKYIKSKYKMIFLTHVWHLRHGNDIWSICELWGIVVDILHFDDELGLRFKRLVCPSVNSLGVEHIVGLLLPVQAFCWVDVTCGVINDKYGPSTFSSKDVLDRPITFVRIGVQL